MDPPRSSHWVFEHRRRYPWRRSRASCAQEWASFDHEQRKNVWWTSAQLDFLGVPTLKGQHSREARWRVGGNAHQPRARPSAMPRGGKLKPDPGQRSLAGATPQEEASPASGHLRSLSISDEVTPLTRLVPPFHSQVSASRARLPSPSPSRRPRPSRRMTLPRLRCLAVEVPASPPPRALDGINQAGRSNRRAGRWRMCPGARRPHRSSPARPRSCTPST